MESTPHGDYSGTRLDWNECPLGPSPRAIARVRTASTALHRYPRGLLGEVTAAVAAHEHVSCDAVLLTNGVDEAVDLVLALTDTGWYVSPGFDSYPDRAIVRGVTMRRIGLDADWQPAVAAHHLRSRGTVFVAQPHNPTGNLFHADWLDDVMHGADLVFLDTTYADFSDDPAAWAPAARTAGRHPQLLHFRSFSKSHGLAGIRLGALIGAPSLIRELSRRQRFHSVDSVALHALAGSLEDPGHRARIREQVLTMRPEYVRALRRHPLFAEVRDTQANFVVSRCRPGTDSADITQALADADVWVRDSGPLGLAGWLRISVGTADDLTRLLSALDTVRTHVSIPRPSPRPLGAPTP
ncbi:pyridoxal phosphate-dependent aminotransferase [Streptomyces sp. NRRL S-448]|uniref:pyridoxal phosphate-dependent aminotransferase n=1 Tax=Streptomyces sp. NRRL S-448 TaxID=1463907 RepID=UPI003567CF56